MNSGFIVMGNPTTVESITELPTEFNLLQNYPNPFNPKTRITYHLPVHSQVHLSVFDALGREIQCIISGEESAGIHTVLWNGTDKWGKRVSSGLYIYRLQAGERIYYKKMLFIQ